MTIQTFIEKATYGGWQSHSVVDSWRKKKGHDLNIHKWALDSMLLDPEAWKAVGQVEGWGMSRDGSDKSLDVMRCMTDALIEGKSIEQFLETL